MRIYHLSPMLYILTGLTSFIVQIGVTVFYCLFAAGVVFGYAALKPVLKKEGAYWDVCGGDYMCTEIHLNLMFTVAAVATNVAALPVGAILDHFGPRVCGILGAAFLTLGSLLMSFAQEMPFDGFLLGYFLLALAGPFTYISSFHLSNAFPQKSGLILALLTGAFDSSSALFLVYRVIFDQTEGRFGHHKFFLVYLVVPAVIFLLQVTILPKQSYKTVGELMDQIDHPDPNGPFQEFGTDGDQVDEQTALLSEEQREYQETVEHEIEDLLGPTEVDKQLRHEEASNERSGVWGVMHNHTALEQIRSPWFILICLFVSTRRLLPVSWARYNDAGSTGGSRPLALYGFTDINSRKIDCGADDEDQLLCCDYTAAVRGHIRLEGDGRRD